MPTFRFPWEVEATAALLVLLPALAFSVLEVHSSTDTWIGLVAGRQIVAEGEFPVTDRMSYTFYGEPWFNQNWLSHAYLWVLYDWIAPDAVIYGTWAIAAAMSVFVVFATRLHCQSWFAACIGGVAAALAGRDWLSARPATVQFFILSLFWLALTGLRTQGARERTWPLVVLGAVFLTWPHAHGSFIFGYFVLGMFVAFGLGPRLLGAPGFLTWRQGKIVGAIGLVTLFFAVVLSPFGLKNITHPFVVTESELFRQVGEWIPPYLPSRWPPVERFWWMLRVAGAMPLLLLMLFIAQLGLGVTPERRSAAAADEPQSPWVTRLAGIGFDVAGLALGLAMAMWARRFAPMLFIFGVPVVTRWLMGLARLLLAEGMRSYVRAIMVAGAAVGGGVLTYYTWDKAHHELVEKVPPTGDFEFNLLDRVTRNYETPRYAMQFLNRNELDPNLWVEWTQGGPVAFNCPQAKVFIDGRSQQVYDEEHYVLYMELLSFADRDPEQTTRILDEHGTDAVLLRPGRHTAPMFRAMLNGPWTELFSSPLSRMFVRNGGEFMQTLIEREISGDLWWPPTAGSAAARARIWSMLGPGRLDEALRFARMAMRGDLQTAVQIYPWLVGAMIRAERFDAAADLIAGEQAWLQAQHARLWGSGAGDLSDEQRDALARDRRLMPKQMFEICFEELNRLQQRVADARAEAADG